MMPKPSQEIQPEQSINQLDNDNDNNLLAEGMPYQTSKQFQDPSRENGGIRSLREYDSLIDVSIRQPKIQLDQTPKGDRKQQQIKKQSKTLIINFQQYLPQFLILLNHVKHKSIIRIGRNYQAVVPRRCNYSYLYRPLSNLKVWSAGEVQPSVLKKFREKFGENRTEEDLCLLMFQYQCDWNQINAYCNQFKGELRRSYLQKDRTKV